MTAEIAAPAYLSLPALGRSRRILLALATVARAALRVRPHCLLFGHDDSFARGPGRLSLRCAGCGRETTGWAIGPGSPVITAPSRVRPAGKSGLGTTVRVGPWTVRQDGRRAARERERLRLVAAASRAVEQRREDSGGPRLIAGTKR